MADKKEKIPPPMKTWEVTLRPRTKQDHSAPAIVIIQAAFLFIEGGTATFSDTGKVIQINDGYHKAIDAVASFNPGVWETVRQVNSSL